MEGNKPIHVYETEDKVRRWLNEIVGPFDGSPPTLACFHVDSTAISVAVTELADEDTIVHAWALIVDSVPRSKELYERVARGRFGIPFGRLIVHDGDNDEVVDIVFENAILGTCIDQPELDHLIRATAIAADVLADQLVEEFGGKLPCVSEGTR